MFLQGLFLLFLWIGPFTKADIPSPTDVCPTGCVCRKRDVKCYQMTEFPTSFPTHATYIFFHELNANIPPNAFAGLYNLHTIEFKQCNIGFVLTCAFKSIDSLQKLKFEQSVIGDLQSFAIHNITGSLSIDFNKCRITKMHPVSISNLTNIKSLKIEESTIFELHTMAIGSVSGELLKLKSNTFKEIETRPTEGGKFGSIEIENNKFEMIPCGTFDDILWSTDGSLITLSGNGVNCDCGLSYVSKIKYDKMMDLLLGLQCIKDGEININQTVKDAQASLNTCKNGGSLTTCVPDPSFKLPKLACPQRIHSHEDLESNNRMGPSGNKSERNSLSFAIVFVILFFRLNIIL